MFVSTVGPTGQFTLQPMPPQFFELPQPFGGAALLVLNDFANNSATLTAEHMAGIHLAAAQAALTFGPQTGSLEIYGITDRAGSENLNKDLSNRRANAALDALRGVMGLGGPVRRTFLGPLHMGRHRASPPSPFAG